MSEPRILVTLCTYNERENIALLVPAVRRVLPEADVLVIDDNSPDGTGRLADELAGSDGRVRACCIGPAKRGSAPPRSPASRRQSPAVTISF